MGLDNPFIANPVMLLNESQTVTYAVQATTSIGCTGTDTVVVKVFAEKDIFVPNAFTPNNDGHNDLLRPKMPGIQTLHYFSIYSRMGQMVYTTNTLGAGWDGVFNGQAMPMGAYVWIAEGVDVEGKTVVRKGTVVLIR
jgi:gliding motility-associated-like protein